MNSRASALTCALVMAALGCNTGPSADATTAAAPTTGNTVRPTVSWPAASTIDVGALAAVGSGSSEREARALVARSPVPVLAPKDLRLTSPTLVVEGEYFALTGRADGVTITLQGTRAAHRYEGVEPAVGNRNLRGTKGFVSINEGIRTASWIENGAAYTVDVECENVRDARCEGEDFLLSIVAQLVFVGGSGR
ncbi:MAG: hypothetical protein KF819_29290 [Labilithrix sp.]|nr:hypothetical protein [Labilithrix sp.]